VESIVSTPTRFRSAARRSRPCPGVVAEFVPARLHEKRSGLTRDNTPGTFTVEEILLHLCTHELRHQGQVQSMLRLLGKKAPNLDWI
jgi:uncharacterized damage-inducible protein DinB